MLCMNVTVILKLEKKTNYTFFFYVCNSICPYLFYNVVV